MLVTLDTSHLEMSPLNLTAWLNMLTMLVTLDTSHLEISPLKLPSPEHTLLISVTPVTSQDPIDPCGPLEHSVVTFTHSLRAAWSSAFDLGANTLVALAVHNFP